MHLRLVKMKVFSKKVFLLYVIIGLMTNVLHGLYNLVKCFTIIQKKQFFTKTRVIKVYDIPIFYLPRLSHPDPSVDRRSGFLPPSFEDTKNLGAGITIPYFFALNKDKNFTLTNKFYASENPLFMGEFHQAFKNSNFLADFGYTEGFKKNTSKKKSGNKSHFFSEFTKNFKFDNNASSSFKFKVQEVSNDKYLKLYKLDSDLVDYNSKL